MKKIIVFFISIVFYMVSISMPLFAAENSARIGTTEYPTIEDAINAAQEITTDSVDHPTAITILTNVEIRTAITLNNNDHILIQSENETDMKTVLFGNSVGRIIENTGASLTLRNITFDGGAIWRVNAGTNEEPQWEDVSGPNVIDAVNKGVSRIQCLINVAAGASLYLADGTSIINADARGSEIGYGSCITNNGDLTIENTTIANNSNVVSAIWNGGNLTINSGSFWGNFGSWRGAIICNSKGTMGVEYTPYAGVTTINGGSFYGNQGYYYGGVIFNNSTLNITGGTFTGNTEQNFCFAAAIYNLGNVNLSGNPVINENYPSAIYNDNQHIYIKDSITLTSNLCLYGEESAINLIGALSQEASIGIDNVGFLNKSIFVNGIDYTITKEDMHHFFVDTIFLPQTSILLLKDNKIILAFFTDIPAGAWYETSVQKLIFQNILTGYNNGDDTYSFKPDNTITRAEFATILAKASGEDLSGYKDKTSFNDVSTSFWGAKYIEWAYQNNIVKGKDGGKYDPDANISRQEMAVMIYRFATVYQGNTLPHNNAALNFTDQSSIATWAKDAVTAMQRASIINGIENTNGSYRFEPNGEATRAQAAKMISKYLGL